MQTINIISTDILKELKHISFLRKNWEESEDPSSKEQLERELFRAEEYFISLLSSLSEKQNTHTMTFNMFSSKVLRSNILFLVLYLFTKDENEKVELVDRLLKEIEYNNSDEILSQVVDILDHLSSLHYLSNRLEGYTLETNLSLEHLKSIFSEKRAKQYQNLALGPNFSVKIGKEILFHWSISPRLGDPETESCVKYNIKLNEIKGSRWLGSKKDCETISYYRADSFEQSLNFGVVLYQNNPYFVISLKIISVGKKKEGSSHQPTGHLFFIEPVYPELESYQVLERDCKKIAGIIGSAVSGQDDIQNEISNKENWREGSGFLPFNTSRFKNLCSEKSDAGGLDVDIERLSMEYGGRSTLCRGDSSDYQIVCDIPKLLEPLKTEYENSPLYECFNLMNLSTKENYSIFYDEKGGEVTTSFEAMCTDFCSEDEYIPGMPIVRYTIQNPYAIVVTSQESKDEEYFLIKDPTLVIEGIPEQLKSTELEESLAFLSGKIFFNKLEQVFKKYPLNLDLDLVGFLDSLGTKVGIGDQSKMHKLEQFRYQLEKELAKNTALGEEIKKCLSVRWENIKDYCITYTCTPNSSTTQLCLRIAQALRNKCYPEESVYKLLMPSLRYLKDTISVYNHENIDAYPLDKLILSSDKESLVYVPGIQSIIAETGDFNFNIVSNPCSKEGAASFTEGERKKIQNHSSDGNFDKLIKLYRKLEFLQESLNKILIEENLYIKLQSELRKLISALKSGGASGSGTEIDASLTAYLGIKAFVEFWFSLLSDKDKKEIHPYILETIDFEVDIYTNKDSKLLTCVEMSAWRLDLLLEGSIFNNELKRKISEKERIQIIEKIIENIRKLSKDDFNSVGRDMPDTQSLFSPIKLCYGGDFYSFVTLKKLFDSIVDPILLKVNEKVPYKSYIERKIMEMIIMEENKGTLFCCLKRLFLRDPEQKIYILLAIQLIEEGLAKENLSSTTRERIDTIKSKIKKGGESSLTETDFDEESSTKSSLTPILFFKKSDEEKKHRLIDEPPQQARPCLASSKKMLSLLDTDLDKKEKDYVIEMLKDIGLDKEEKILGIPALINFLVTFINSVLQEAFSPVLSQTWYHLSDHLVEPDIEMGSNQHLPSKEFIQKEFLPDYFLKLCYIPQDREIWKELEESEIFLNLAKKMRELIEAGLKPQLLTLLISDYFTYPVKIMVLKELNIEQIYSFLVKDFLIPCQKVFGIEKLITLVKENCSGGGKPEDLWNPVDQKVLQSTQDLDKSVPTRSYRL